MELHLSFADFTSLISASKKRRQIFFQLPSLSALPLYFAHQREQIVFGVAEEGHPQIVVGHARDHVRLVLKTHTFLFQSCVCRLHVRYREIEDRCRMVELRLFWAIEHQANSMAVEEGKPRRRFE